MKNFFLFLTFTGLLFSLIVIFDGAIGLVAKEAMDETTSEGLIFNPNSKAIHKTVEFNYVADINSIGLRDREINIEKGKKLRILCFGDSVTYGWGVNIENSWPKKLERYLNKNGFDNIEIINCGQPGQYTKTYKQNMEKVIPFLKPDIVLVGVLQADDLAQSYETNFFGENAVSNKTTLLAMVKFLKHSIYNILMLLEDSKPETVDIQANWKESTNALMSKFGPFQNLAFNNLNDSVKSLFKSGNLNPGLLNYYIYYPNNNLLINNPNHKATQYAINDMKKDIADMKALCIDHQAKLIFINIPISSYIGHLVIRGPNDILNPYFLANNHIDSIYQNIAAKYQLPYVEMTGHFLSLNDKTGYFYKYDGHPNQKGYEEIANYIGKQLMDGNYLKKNE